MIAGMGIKLCTKYALYEQIQSDIVKPQTP